MVSAHRTPDTMFEYAEQRARARASPASSPAPAAPRTCPGMIASKTTLPVLGVPVPSRHLAGQDSLYSIVQMPKGIPVATFAIGEAGAANAGLFAVSLLAGSDAGLAAQARRVPREAARAGGGDAAARRACDSRRGDRPDASGLLGGGQLGRMFTVAARTLGYRVTVLDPDPLSPAAEFATGHLNTAYTDPASLDELARTCAAVTTEFENAPAEALDAIAARTVVRPSGASVAVAQDRRREKGFFAERGFPLGAWARDRLARGHRRARSRA